MASVGTAYVTIKVNTKGFEAQLDKMMARLGRSMEKSGRDMGMQFNKGLSSVGPSSFFDQFADQADKATTKAAGSVDKLGDAFDRNNVKGQQFGSDIIDVMDVVGESTRDARKDVDDLGRGFNDADKSASRLRSSMGGIGGGGGGLRSGASDAGFFSSALSKLSNDAEGAFSSLHHLHDAVAFGGNAMAGLVSAASAAAQGIFALASEALSAAPALSVLSNAAIGFIQIGGTIAAATSGVSSAIKLGFSSMSSSVASSASGMATAVTSALRSVRDAKQGLADAYAQSAQAAADAARRVADAERAVGAAQDGVRAAQLALNAARKEGLQQLQDIAFAAEDADLAQQRAALNLEDAYNALQAVQNLPPNDRARREAELNFKEAELQLREAKDRKKDADKEQKHAQKTGVKGTEAVQTAYDNLHSAQDQLAQSTRSLNDARRQEAQVAVENARRIQDAQQRLADAQANLADAQSKNAAGSTAATTALNKYNAALKKLGPNQQAFVKNVIASRGEFTKARNAIAEPMFDNLNRALDHMVGGKAWDVVIKGMSGTSDQLGILAEKSINLANTDMFSSRLGEVMATNNQAIGIFGGTFRKLLQLVVNVADAARPLILTFAKWTRKVTDGWLATRRTNDQISDMRLRFIQAGKRAANLKDFLVALYNVVKTVGKAAAIATRHYQGLNDQLNVKRENTGFFVRMTNALKKFDDRLNKPRNFKKMVKGFDQALQNMEASAKAAKNAILDPLVAIGQDKRLETSMDKIAKSKVFKQLEKTALDALPGLTELALHLLDIVNVMSNSGSMVKFFKVLNSVAGAVASVFIEVGKHKGLVTLLGTIVGVSSALRILRTAFTLMFSPLIVLGKRLGVLGGQFKTFVNKDADPKKTFSARWSRAWAGFKRTGTNTLISVGNGFKKLTNVASGALNKISFGKIRKTNFGPTAKIPAPDVQPPVADPTDKAKAQAAGLSMTEAFAQGIREGLPAKDAAMNALRQNVMTMLTEMQPIVQGRAIEVGASIIAGLVEGIDAAKTGVIAAAEAAGAAAAKAVGKGAQVQSPSRITIVDGTQIMAGLTVGIEEGQTGAILAAEAAGAKVAGAVGTGARGATASVEAAGLAAGSAPAASLGAAGAPMTGVTSKFGKLGKAMGPLTKLAKPLAGGMRLIGGAFSLMLGPVGMIVLTLFPILWPLLVKLEKKTHIFSKALGLLEKAFGPVAHAAKVVFQKIMDFIQPVLDFVKDHWKLIIGLLTGPIGIAVFLIHKYWDKITGAFTAVIDFIKKHWKAFAIGLATILLGPIGGIVVFVITHFSQIVDFLKGLPDKIKGFLSHMWDVVTEKLSDAYDKVKNVWGKVVSWVKGRPAQFRANLKALWNVVTDKLTSAWHKVQSIWGKVVAWVKGRPAQFKANLKLLWSVVTDKLHEAYDKVLSTWATVTTWIKGRPDQFKTNMAKLWDVIVDKLNDAYDKVKSIWGRVTDWIGGLPDKIRGKLAHIWDGLKDGFASAANWVIGKVQSWLIDPLNSILSKFGVDGISINLPTIPGHAEGGWVRGPGGPKEDRVLRRLSNGEYVMPARSAHALGPDALEYMRKYGKLPDTGGLWGAIKAGGSWVKGGVTKISDAISHGAKYAIEWAVSRFATKVPKNFFSDAFVGGLKWAASKFVAFGDKLDASTNKWVYPVDHIVPISQHPNSGHNPPNAVDFDGDFGDRILAAANGTVVAALKWTTSYGKHIIIQHLNGIQTLYAHMKQLLVSTGQQVRAGQTIGLMGSTGNSTGSHLHFEVNPSADSEAFLRKMGVKFATGGIARATDGGILSVIAEAGKNERVEPLDSMGMSKRDHVLLEMIRSLIHNGQGGDTWNIHPAPGMNEIEFSKQVRREVVFHRRRGA